MSNHETPGVNGAQPSDAAEEAAAQEEQPLPGETAPEQPKIPTLEMDDTHAEHLTMALLFALQNMRLFEGAVVTNRVSMRAVEGPVAMTIATQLVQFMRGQAPRQYTVRKTLRDLFRGIPLPPQLEEALHMLHPNSSQWGTEFTVQDDDNTPAAKVAFSVQMVPTIIIPGAKLGKQ